MEALIDDGEVVFDVQAKRGEAHNNQMPVASGVNRVFLFMF